MPMNDICQRINCKHISCIICGRDIGCLQCKKYNDFTTESKCAKCKSREPKGSVNNDESTL